MTPKPPALDPAVTERIGDFLRARGLRRMASRIQVLAVLEPVSGHLPVAEIAEWFTVYVYLPKLRCRRPHRPWR